MKDRFLGMLFSGLRVWLGIKWLEAGLHKVGSPAWTGDQAGTAVTRFLNAAIEKAAGENPTVQAWYADFLRHYALPNAKLFSYLVAWGEVLVGIALILGVFVFFSAAVGALMNLNFLLAGTLSTNPVMYTMAVLVMLGLKHAKFISVDRVGERVLPPSTIKAYLMNRLKFGVS